MFYTRAALCAVLLLGGVIGVAQTVIRIAPPPPVRVGVVGVAPGSGYVWVGGYQRWKGNGYVCVRPVLVPFGSLPVTSKAAAAGCITKGTGAEKTRVQKLLAQEPSVRQIIRLFGRGFFIPQVTIKTGLTTPDGGEELLTEYLCDHPGCPNIATQALGCVRELSAGAVTCDEHAPKPRS